MKIPSLFGKGKTVFSFEIFPPKKDGSIDTVYKTLDAVDEIASVPTDRNDRPLNDVRMKRVYIAD